MNPTTDHSTNRQWSEGTSPLCGVIDTGDRKMKDEHTANVLRQIADEIERVGVERAHEGFEVSSPGSDDWTPMLRGCLWEDLAYNVVRPRPRTIQIGDHTVPEPLRVAPEVGTTFYIVNVGPLQPMGHEWRDLGIDHWWLNRGLTHATKEAAAQHARALIAVSGGEVGE